MVPISKSMDELRKLSEKLNSETDSLNELYEKVDRDLAAAKVGVSHWLGLSLSEEHLRPSVDRSWTIGYCKVGDSWHLAAKQQLWTMDGDEWNATDTGATPVLLTAAPRIVRVEAAAHLEQLIEELKKKVATFVENIEKAKENAKK